VKALVSSAFTEARDLQSLVTNEAIAGARYERVGNDGFWITSADAVPRLPINLRPPTWSDSEIASAVLTYLDSLAGHRPTLKGYERFRSEHPRHLPSLSSLEVRGGTEWFNRPRAELLDLLPEGDADVHKAPDAFRSKQLSLWDEPGEGRPGDPTD
jgi:hypothetical protein